MKNQTDKLTRLTAGILMAAGLILSACSDEKPVVPDPVFSVSPATPAAFSANAAESHSYTVTTDQAAWDAVSGDDSWCVVTKSTEGDGFIVSVLPNIEAQPRSTEITVTAGELAPIVIAVTQAARTATDEFAGTITRNGETATVARSGFCHLVSGDTDFFRINISPDNIEGIELGEQMEMLEIEVPAAMLDTEIDLAAGPHSASGAYLYVGYRRSFADYDVYVNEVSSGTMRVGVDTENARFTVRLTDVKLHGGTVVSCEAAGVVADALTDKFGGSFHGTADYTVKGHANVPYTYTTADLYFARSRNSLGAGVTELYISAKEGESVNVLGDDRIEKDYSFAIMIDHPGMNLTSGTYTLAYSYFDLMSNEDVVYSLPSPDGLNIASGGTHNWSHYVPDRNGDGDTSDADILFKGGTIAGGTLDIEVSERYLKIRLNDLIDDYRTIVPAAEFVFDYTEQ